MRRVRFPFILLKLRTLKTFYSPKVFGSMPMKTPTLCTLYPDGDRCERRPADRKRQGYEHPRQHSTGRQGHGKDRRQSQHRDLAGKRNLRGEEHIGRLRSLVGYSLGKILQAHVRPFSGQRDDRLPL